MLEANQQPGTDKVNNPEIGDVYEYATIGAPGLSPVQPELHEAFTQFVQAVEFQRGAVMVNSGLDGSMMASGTAQPIGTVGDDVGTYIN